MVNPCVCFIYEIKTVFSGDVSWRVLHTIYALDFWSSPVLTMTLSFFFYISYKVSAVEEVMKNSALQLVTVIL